MTPKPDTIAIENVNLPGQTSNVNKTKYLAVKSALLKTLPKKSPGLTFNEACEIVKPHLEEWFPGGEKVGWWVKTVQLDLEAKGILVRIESKPLRWYRA